MEIHEVDQEKRDIIKFVDEHLFKNAKAWKAYYAGDKQERWLENIRMVKGLQWPANVPQEKTHVVINRIWSGIQKELPFMTDNKPLIYVEPFEPEDKVAADLFKQIIETNWIQRSMMMKIPEGTLHTKEVGTAFYEPFWNEKLANGLGDMDCRVLDPLNCFPFAYTNELTMDNCEGFIWAGNVSLGYVKENYDEGWRVKAQTDQFIPDRARETNMASDEAKVRQISDMGAGSSYTAAQTNYLPSVGSKGLSSENLKQVTLIKCFMRDGAVKEDGESGKKEIKKEKMYPFGRMITLAGGIVLKDEPWPFEFFPYIDQKNYIMAGEFWGEDDVKQVKDNQLLYNKIVSMLTDAVKRGIYTVKFIKMQSGIEADNFYVSSDAAYDTKIDNPVSELTPQALPPQAFAFPQFIEQAIEKTFGMQDLTAPQSAASLPSGRSLAEFQEITQTRLRQKIRNLGDAIRRIGSDWLEMILKNYTEDRIMRLFNSTSGKQEYAFIFKEADPAKAQAKQEEAEQMIISGTEEKDPQTGQPVPGSGRKKYAHVLNLAKIKGGFDLNVSEGSTVSTSKFSNFQQSFALYQGGAIDRQALLDAADYPNKDEIIKRMEAQAQIAQQAQAQAMQAETQMKQQDGQIKSQTTLQKTQMDNQTDLTIAGIRDRTSQQQTESGSKLKQLEMMMRGGMQ